MVIFRMDVELGLIVVLRELLEEFMNLGYGTVKIMHRRMFAFQ